MKTHRLKNNFKLGIFIFGISIFIFACQDETISNEPVEQQNSIGFKVKTIYAKQIHHNRKLLDNLKSIEQKNRPVTENTMARQVHDSVYGFTINTEVANYIEYGNYHSYTFAIEREVDNGLTENLFLSLQNDGTYKAFLVSYNLTQQERENLLINEDIDLSQDGKIVWQQIDINPDNIFQRNIYVGDGIYYNDEMGYCFKEIKVISKATGWVVPAEKQVDCPQEVQDYIDSGIGPDSDGGFWDDGNDNPSDGTGTPPLDGSGGGGDGTGSNTGNSDQTDPNDDTNDQEEPVNCLQLDENGNCIGDITSPIIPVEIEITPCKSLRNLSKTDSLSPNIKPIIDSLKGKTNLNKEWYIQFERKFENGAYKNYPQPGGIKEGVNSTTSNINTWTFIIGAAHTHPNETNAMFSWSDLKALRNLYRDVGAFGKEYVFNICVNYDGTVYALKINDFDTLTAKIENDWDNARGNNDEKKRDNLEWELEKKYERDGNLERVFLKKFKNYGVSLYKAADDNLSNWNKLELDNPSASNPNVTSTPCN